MNNKYHVRSEYQGKMHVAVTKVGSKITQEEILIPATVKNHEAIQLVQRGIPASFFEWEEGVEDLAKYEGHKEAIAKVKSVKKVKLGERKGGAKPASTDNTGLVKVKLYEGLGVKKGKEVFEASIEELSERKDLEKIAKVFDVEADAQSVYNAIH